MPTDQVLTGEELAERARELGIAGRTTMSADDLRAAVDAAEAGYEVTAEVPDEIDKLRKFGSHLARDTTELQNRALQRDEAHGIVDGRVHGARVLALQAALQSQGYHVQPDGQYGAQTIAAINRFCQDQGLSEPDGVNKKLAAAIVRGMFD